MQEAEADNRVRLHLTARFESDVQLAAGSLTALESLINAFLGAERGPLFSLACHEAVMNAIMHSHDRDRSRFVVLELVVRTCEIEARVSDQQGSLAVATRYSSELANPYSDKEVSSLPESGVGAWLIQQGADEVSYEVGPDGGCLVLRAAMESRPLPF